MTNNQNKNWQNEIQSFKKEGVNKLFLKLLLKYGWYDYFLFNVGDNCIFDNDSEITTFYKLNRFWYTWQKPWSKLLMKTKRQDIAKNYNDLGVILKNSKMFEKLVFQTDSDNLIHGIYIDYNEFAVKWSQFIDSKFWKEAKKLMYNLPIVSGSTHHYLNTTNYMLFYIEYFNDDLKESEMEDVIKK